MWEKINCKAITSQQTSAFTTEVFWQKKKKMQTLAIWNTFLNVLIFTNCLNKFLFSLSYTISTNGNFVILPFLNSFCSYFMTNDVSFRNVFESYFKSSNVWHFNLVFTFLELQSNWKSVICTALSLATQMEQVGSRWWKDVSFFAGVQYPTLRWMWREAFF